MVDRERADNGRRFRDGLKISSHNATGSRELCSAHFATPKLPEQKRTFTPENGVEDSPATL
jgi:hypothetical protein